MSLLRTRQGSPVFYNTVVLVAFFAAETAASLDKKAPDAPPELLTLLENYHFPGNVRELRAMVFDAVARHKSGPVLAAKIGRAHV